MNTPSQDYIDYICSLYNDRYDDRIENNAPPTAGEQVRTPGEDWKPGTPANHKSLTAFQRELKDRGIDMSTSKIKKILITGGLWTTERTRSIQALFSLYTASPEEGGKWMTEAEAIKKIAAEKGISIVSVSVSLPYSSGVYNLPKLSLNAQRCRRYQERKRRTATETKQEISKAEVAVTALRNAEGDWSVPLWRCICVFEGEQFATSGRGSKPGIAFTYTVSRSTGTSGRHYSGTSIDGYGNELWIRTMSTGEKRKKSISRSTVDLAYAKAMELDGKVKGPKALGVPGAGSYLYPIFQRIGVIKRD